MIDRLPYDDAREASDHLLSWIRARKVEKAGASGFAFTCNESVTLLSRCFAILALEGLGAVSLMSPDDRMAMADDLKRFQLEDDGLFYDPELQECDLNHPGNDFRYLNWQQTYFALSAIDALGERGRTPCTVIERFDTTKKVTSWMEQLDWHNPWVITNDIMFVLFFLTYDSNYESVIHGALDWLDSRQDSSTGFWGLHEQAPLINAMAGAYHLIPFYLYLNRPIRFPDRMIDATLALRHRDGLFHPWGGGGTCHDLDAIDILAKCTGLTNHRRPEVAKVLAAAKNVLLRLQNVDGGYAESLGRKSPKSWKRLAAEYLGIAGLLGRNLPSQAITLYSGWAKMRCHVRESNMWAAWFRPLAIATSEAVPSVAADSQQRFPAWKFRRLPGLGWHEAAVVKAP